jgi:hypothetical protein
MDQEAVDALLKSDDIPRITAFIVEKGTEVNKQYMYASSSDEYIPRLLHFHASTMSLFHAHIEKPDVQDAITKAFGDILDQSYVIIAQGTQLSLDKELVYTPVRHLHHYVQSLIGRDVDKAREVMPLLQLLKDTEEFLTTYAKDLRLRLMNSKCDLQAEGEVATVLAQTFGSPSIGTINSLLKDVSRSLELSQVYGTKYETAACTFSATVFVQRLPESDDYEFKLPTSLVDHQTQFSKMHNDKGPYRITKWINRFTTATMTLQFDQGPKEVVVNALQASVILLVDEKGPISMEAISHELAIKMDILRRHMAPIVVASNTRFLLSVDREGVPTSEPTLKPETHFVYNNGFKSKFRKLKVSSLSKNQFQALEFSNVQDQARIRYTLCPDITRSVFACNFGELCAIPLDALCCVVDYCVRTIDSTNPSTIPKIGVVYVIDSTVVHLAKRKKGIPLTTLHQEALYIVSKKVTAYANLSKEVMRRIDNLIEREYLRKSPEDPTLIEYIV